MLLLVSKKKFWKKTEKKKRIQIFLCSFDLQQCVLKVPHTLGSPMRSDTCAQLKPFVRWRQCLLGQGLSRTGNPNNKVSLCIPFISLAIGFVHFLD